MPRSSKRRWSAILFFLSASLAGCDGHIGLGEACPQELNPDVCDEGLLCSKDQGGRVRCQQICLHQTDCPVDAICTNAGITRVCAVVGGE